MRIEKFHYYLLDSNDMPKDTGIGDTNELFNVLEADISYNSLGRLKSSLTVKIMDSEYLNIDYLNDRIKVVMEIDGLFYNKGIYLISSTERNIEPTQTTRFLTCYSKLKILDMDKILTAYYLPKGSNVRTAIVNLLGSNPNNITSSDAALNTDYTATYGTSKLDIINDLLDIINYTSLYVDDNGYFASTPYELPQDRDIDVYYIEGEPHSDDEDNVCRLISGSITEDLDAFDVPNIFFKYTNDVDIDPPITAVYPIQQGDNTTTIDGRAPNVDIEEVSDVSDYATLYAKCKRSAADARSIYSHLEIQTALNPKHGYMTCVNVNVGDIDYKYIETGWSVDLKAGALMKHTLRRVVELDG